MKFTKIIYHDNLELYGMLSYIIHVAKVVTWVCPHYRACILLQGEGSARWF